MGGSDPAGGGGGQVQPGGGSAKIGQQNEYSLLHGGRYASCIHAGGLSCIIYFSTFEFFYQCKKYSMILNFPNFVSGFSQRFRTESSYSYERLLYRVASLSYIVFKVKVCADAHVALLDVAHTEKVYEIVLGAGGNTYSSIRFVFISQTRLVWKENF